MSPAFTELKRRAKRICAYAIISEIANENPVYGSHPESRVLSGTIRQFVCVANISFSRQSRFS